MSRDQAAVTKVLVRCTFEIEVEVPVEWAEMEDDAIRWQIEENGCPGTGVVGAAIDEHIEKMQADGVCWACALQGTNKVIDWTYATDDPKLPANPKSSDYLNSATAHRRPGERTAE